MSNIRINGVTHADGLVPAYRTRRGTRHEERDGYPHRPGSDKDPIGAPVGRGAVDCTACIADKDDL